MREGKPNRQPAQSTDEQPRALPFPETPFQQPIAGHSPLPRHPPLRLARAQPLPTRSCSWPPGPLSAALFRDSPEATQWCLRGDGETPPPPRDPPRAGTGTARALPCSGALLGMLGPWQRTRARPRACTRAGVQAQGLHACSACSARGEAFPGSSQGAVSSCLASPACAVFLVRRQVPSVLHACTPHPSVVLPCFVHSAGERRWRLPGGSTCRVSRSSTSTTQRGVRPSAGLPRAQQLAALSSRRLEQRGREVGGRGRRRHASHSSHASVSTEGHPSATSLHQGQAPRRSGSNISARGEGGRGEELRSPCGSRRREEGGGDPAHILAPE